MGRKLTLTEEAQALRDIIREAHEATQDLRAAIREAQRLAPTLVAKFEQVHEQEIRVLSNYFTNELNEQATRMNESVQEARNEILRELTISELTLDKDSNEMRVRFSGSRFDDHRPLPFPNAGTKENHQ